MFIFLDSVIVGHFLSLGENVSRHWVLSYVKQSSGVGASNAC